MKRRLTVLAVSLFTLSVSLSGLVQAPAAHAAFPGTNGKIVYSGQSGNLWLVNSNGTGGSQLTTTFGSPGLSYLPQFSPDGQWVAFEGTTTGGNFDIYKINVNGTGLQQLTASAGTQDSEPNWSPDGSRIIWSAQGKIKSMAADGSDVKLIQGAGANYGPQYSPNGAQIYFFRNTAPNQLFRMRANGSHVNHFVHSSGNDRSPDVSPDGTRLLFTSTRSGSSQVWRVLKDGSKAHQLTTGQNTYAAAYSPDGLQFAFVTSIYQLNIANADGSNVTFVIGSAGTSGVSWQPV